MKAYLLGALLGLSLLHPAQGEENVSHAPLKNPPAANTAAAPVSKAEKPVSLESSYKREFALLQTQKSELQNRLYSYKAKAEGAEKTMLQKVAAFEHANVSLAAQEDSLRDELVKAEHSNEAVNDNSDLLEMTYSQANSSLAAYQRSLEKNPEFMNAAAEQKLSLLFQQGAGLINELALIKNREAGFFLSDGTQTQGTVINVGNIAAYGVSEKGSGILVPAGEGRLKLWSQPAAETAKQMAAGQAVSLQKIFIFENSLKAVEEKQEKTLLEEVEEGGEIAWIIVMLGIIATFLITGRIVLLFLASRGKAAMIDKAFSLLQHNRKDAALTFCEKSKGPFARVIAAVIRHANANPEHMDDVIAEALLHESSTLNRFGAAIVVIASVAPLVGLLGTVTGMIATFGLITEHGTGDPRLLSSGISIALVTTELGLVVAIPSGLAGSLLGGWSEGIKSSLEEIALRASNILLDREHSLPLASLDKKNQAATLSLA